MVSMLVVFCFAFSLSIYNSSHFKISLSLVW
uniref:Uncharacterized protein n=1 Tax=Rhizophora mucronata TaxID=61149 RepID=A0A2P2R4M7_RHIMU